MFISKNMWGKLQLEIKILKNTIKQMECEHPPYAIEFHYDGFGAAQGAHKKCLNCNKVLKWYNNFKEFSIEKAEYDIQQAKETIKRSEQTIKQTTVIIKDKKNES